MVSWQVRCIVDYTAADDAVARIVVAGLVRAGMPLEVWKPKVVPPRHEECSAKFRQMDQLSEAGELAWNMDKLVERLEEIRFRFWYRPALLNNLGGQPRVDSCMEPAETNEYLTAIWCLKQEGFGKHRWLAEFGKQKYSIKGDGKMQDFLSLMLQGSFTSYLLGLSQPRHFESPVIPSFAAQCGLC